MIQTNKQIGGSHYLGLAIQPVEYIQANNIPFMEGSAIKYLTRWRDKGGIEDLKKARHFIEMLIEYESYAKHREPQKPPSSPSTESYRKGLKVSDWPLQAFEGPFRIT